MPKTKRVKKGAPQPGKWLKCEEKLLKNATGQSGDNGEILSYPSEPVEEQDEIPSNSTESSGEAHQCTSQQVDLLSSTSPRIPVNLSRNSTWNSANLSAVSGGNYSEILSTRSEPMEEQDGVPSDPSESTEVQGEIPSHPSEATEEQDLGNGSTEPPQEDPGLRKRFRESNMTPQAEIKEAVSKTSFVLFSALPFPTRHAPQFLALSCLLSRTKFIVTITPYPGQPTPARRFTATLFLRTQNASRPPIRVGSANGADEEAARRKCIDQCTHYLFHILKEDRVITEKQVLKYYSKAPHSRTMVVVDESELGGRGSICRGDPSFKLKKELLKVNGNPNVHALRVVGAFSGKTRKLSTIIVVQGLLSKMQLQKDYIFLRKNTFLLFLKKPRILLTQNCMIYDETNMNKSAKRSLIDMKFRLFCQPIQFARSYPERYLELSCAVSNLTYTVTITEEMGTSDESRQFKGCLLVGKQLFSDQQQNWTTVGAAFGSDASSARSNCLSECVQYLAYQLQNSNLDINDNSFKEICLKECSPFIMVARIDRLNQLHRHNYWGKLLADMNQNRMIFGLKITGEHIKGLKRRLKRNRLPNGAKIHRSSSDRHLLILKDRYYLMGQ